MEEGIISLVNFISLKKVHDRRGVGWRRGKYSITSWDRVRKGISSTKNSNNLTNDRTRQESNKRKSNK